MWKGTKALVFVTGAINTDRQEALDTRPWTLDSGHWTLDTGHSTLNTGHWTLDRGYWTGMESIGENLPKNGKKTGGQEIIITLEQQK